VSESASPEIADRYESVLEFLYRAPLACVRTRDGGEIDMISPASVQMLAPYARGRPLVNLFDTLDESVPELRLLVEQFTPACGTVCERLRVPMATTDPSQPSAPGLSLSVHKLDAGRLFFLLHEGDQQALDGGDPQAAVEQPQVEQPQVGRRTSDAPRSEIGAPMPNRAAIRAQLQAAILRGRTSEFAVLYINCDRLKRINDVLGHAVGDQLLNQMAERLRSTLRSNDRMAARIGGDEFVVLLGALTSQEDAQRVTRRLLDKMLQPYLVSGQTIHATVSIGIVLRADGTGDADTVLQRASLAMAEAKRAGGARAVVFEPAMQERAARRVGIEADLRRALLEKQLFVAYQPIVDLQTRSDANTSLEALVRWQHPTRGVVPPLEFIGVAEECGLIGPIGNFVLSTACHQFAEWQRQLGPQAPRMLAVNLSRAQLFEPDLVQTVSAILLSSGMQPDQLQLEVTESLAAQDESVQKRLSELKALRLTLALDDFGTGYSSLASLHQLPIDTVKIDRSFVSQADTSHHHRVLIEATLRVARSLGLHTVAEGIETLAQANVVRDLGCEKGQGFLFSAPLTADELLDWLALESRPLNRRERLHLRHG